MEGGAWVSHPGLVGGLLLDDQGRAWAAGNRWCRGSSCAFLPRSAPRRRAPGAGEGDELPAESVMVGSRGAAQKQGPSYRCE